MMKEMMTAVETLTGELLAKVAERKPAAVCVGSLPPGGLSHARYLCKRLKRRLAKPPKKKRHSRLC